MSEPEQEPLEAPESPEEPETAPEPDEEVEEAEEADQEPVEEPEQEPAGGPEGFSERDLEKARKRIEGEETRHRNRVSEIMGEEANFLTPCPLCSGFVSGLIFPQVPEPAVVDAVRVAIGLPDLSNYQPAKDARQCPDCAGLGVVLSGSLIAENAAITCKSCNGSGYVMLEPTGEMTGPTVHTNGGAKPEVPVGVNPDDPAVKALRERGFTVFPPVQLPTGAGS